MMELIFWLFVVISFMIGSYMIISTLALHIATIAWIIVDSTIVNIKYHIAKIKEERNENV